MPFDEEAYIKATNTKQGTPSSFHSHIKRLIVCVLVSTTPGYGTSTAFQRHRFKSVLWGNMSYAL